MKLPTLWITSHGINQRVIDSVKKGTGFPVRDTELLSGQPVHAPAISYGILRGTTAAYAQAQNFGLDWYEIDNGYFNRGHFDGCYRISRNGLTCRYDAKIASKLPYDRWRKLGKVIRPWQHNPDGHILVCPPTEFIESFYGMEESEWEKQTVKKLASLGNSVKVRKKDNSDVPLSSDLKNCKCVITFNSNVGIDALLEGVPVITSEHHPINSWNGLTIDNFSQRNLYEADRLSLFKYLSHFQYTLEELERAKTWRDIFNLLGSNVDIPGFYSINK